MGRADSLGKTLMMGKIEGKTRRGDREWDGWMASPSRWTWVGTNSGRQWRAGKAGTLQPMESRRVGHDLVTGQQNELNLISRTYSSASEDVYIFWQAGPHVSHPPAPDDHPSTVDNSSLLCRCEFKFLDFTYKWDNMVFLFLCLVYFI